MECSFVDESWAGIMTFAPSRNVEIRGSSFVSNEVAVILDGTTDATISDCIITECHSGVQYSSNTTGRIVDCIIEKLVNMGVIVTIGASVELSGNRILGGAACLQVYADSHATGSGNIFEGGSYATIRCVDCTMDFHGNHILNAGEFSVRLLSFPNQPLGDIDLTNNYWGTSDSEQIAEWIEDGHDDPGIDGFVLYEPFSAGPMGSKRKSWGAVKNLYR